ncbi:MAG: ribonuclease E/G [Caulobacteraceae bacterium]
MSGRRLYLDACPGERRGVVTLDDLPERLFIERDGAEAAAALGSRWRGRVASIARDATLAYVELGTGPAGALKLAGRAAALAEGAVIEVEVAAEARGDKGPLLAMLGPAAGAVGLLQPAPTLEARLTAAAPGEEILRGEAAREAAEEAQDAALAVAHRLKGGVTLTIEPTRALVAIDVDRDPQAGASAKAVLDANLRAIRHAARLLRLKALGGTVVIDLIGFPREDGLIRAEARRAFEPDGPGVTVLPVSRLGLLQLAKPHRERPVRDLLHDPDGRPSARTIAQQLVRDLERQGRADPGARLVAACAPQVAAALRPLVAALGPRFQVREALGSGREDADIRPA